MCESTKPEGRTWKKAQKELSTPEENAVLKVLASLGKTLCIRKMR